MEEDVTANIVQRRWTKNMNLKKGNEGRSANTVQLKLLHWNVLAQRVCDNFDKIDDDANEIQFENKVIKIFINKILKNE